MTIQVNLEKSRYPYNNTFRKLFKSDIRQIGEDSQNSVFDTSLLKTGLNFKINSFKRNK